MADDKKPASSETGRGTMIHRNVKTLHGKGVVPDKPDVLVQSRKDRHKGIP